MISTKALATGVASSVVLAGAAAQAGPAKASWNFIGFTIYYSGCTAAATPRWVTPFTGKTTNRGHATAGGCSGTGVPYPCIATGPADEHSHGALFCSGGGGGGWVGSTVNHSAFQNSYAFMAQICLHCGGQTFNHHQYLHAGWKGS
jgi:hypothetical protein